MRQISSTRYYNYNFGKIKRIILHPYTDKTFRFYSYDEDSELIIQTIFLATQSITPGSRRVDCNIILCPTLQNKNIQPWKCWGAGTVFRLYIFLSCQYWCFMPQEQSDGVSIVRKQVLGLLPKLSAHSNRRLFTPAGWPVETPAGVFTSKQGWAGTLSSFLSG